MLEKLKLLLGITGTAQDELLAFLIEMTVDEAKNYCHIEVLPPEIHNLIVRMAADLYRLEGYGAADRPQRASSVTRGDVSVSFSSAAQQVSGGKSLLEDYRGQLQVFRRLQR